MRNLALYLQTPFHLTPAPTDNNFLIFDCVDSVQRHSAYGELENLAPLTDEQLRTPAVLRTEPVRQKPLSPRRSPGTLYKEAPTSAPQMILDATQTLAHEVIQTLSPRKTRSGSASASSSAHSETLIKPREPASLGGGILGGLIPSTISALWNNSEEPVVPTGELVEVTKALQNPSSVTSTARKQRPVSYGGAYAASPYHIQRPNHIEINDFPSPSHTPYNPAASRRTRE